MTDEKLAASRAEAFADAATDDGTEGWQLLVTDEIVQKAWDAYWAVRLSGTSHKDPRAAMRTAIEAIVPDLLGSDRCVEQ